MENNISQLIEKFSKIFPTIDFSDITSGYEQVEKKLLPFIDSFSKQQWEAILRSEYNDLFQSGLPHISWSTDRSMIIFQLIKNLKPYSTGHSTWYDTKKYSVVTRAGVILDISIEEPRSFSGGSYHRHIHVSDTFIPVPSHRAIIIAIGQDTQAFIKDQFAGTLNECENWVSKNAKDSFFKIMPIE